MPVCPVHSVYPPALNPFARLVRFPYHPPMNFRLPSSSFLPSRFSVLGFLLLLASPSAFATGLTTSDELHRSSATIAATLLEVYETVHLVVLGLAAFALLAVGGAALMGRFAAPWFLSILGGAVALSFVSSIVGVFIDPAGRSASEVIKGYASAHSANPWGGAWFDASYTPHNPHTDNTPTGPTRPPPGPTPSPGPEGPAVPTAEHYPDPVPDNPSSPFNRMNQENLAVARKNHEHLATWRALESAVAEADPEAAAHINRELGKLFHADPGLHHRSQLVVRTNPETGLVQVVLRSRGTFTRTVNGQVVTLPKGPHAAWEIPGVETVSR